MSDNDTQVRNLTRYRRLRELLTAANRGGWVTQRPAEAGVADRMVYLYICDLHTRQLIAGGMPVDEFYRQAESCDFPIGNERVELAVGVLCDLFDQSEDLVEAFHGIDLEEAGLAAGASYLGVTEAWRRIRDDPAAYHFFVVLYRLHA